MGPLVFHVWIPSFCFRKCPPSICFALRGPRGGRAQPCPTSAAAGTLGVRGAGWGWPPQNGAYRPALGLGPSHVSSQWHCLLQRISQPRPAGLIHGCVPGGRTQRATSARCSLLRFLLNPRGCLSLEPKYIQFRLETVSMCGRREALWVALSISESRWC